MTIPPEILEWLAASGGAWALVFARTLGLAATAPGWGTQALGGRLRVGLAALLTAALAPMLAEGIAAPEGAGLVLGVAAEAAIGAGLGLAIGLVVAGARQAGEVVGAQAGLAAASLFDPDVEGDLNPLGHLYGLVALAAFLALDGPITLVGTLAESYRVLPAGATAPSPEASDWAFGRVGWAFALALRAAAPAALAVALAGIVLALVQRAAPGVGLANLSLPARAVVGLLVVVLGLVTLAATFAAGWEEAMGLGR